MARQLISGCLQLLKDMAVPMISGVVGQLESAAYETTKEEVKAIKDVEKGVEKLGGELTRIQAVLFDAEKRAINDAGIQDWLDKLKEVSFDIDDVLDEWNTAVSKSNLEKEEKEGEDAPPSAKKVRLSLSMSSWFSGSPVLVHDLIVRRNIASKIRELNERLDAIAVEQSRYNFSRTSIEDIKEPERPKTTSFIDVSEVYGREEEIEVLLSKLLSESSNTRGLDIIPIVGMGGIGKTTLAQLLYNDAKVKVHFEKRIWICVSDPFDEKRVAKAIIEALKGCASDFAEMQSLLLLIQESVEGKRCLFVLDDVWTDDATKWKPLEEAMKNSARGSRILVTTRKKEVAIMMGAESHIFPIKLLSGEICWSIFRQLAFMDEDGCDELEEIGRKIVIKCKGLPLVAKTLGSLMRYRKGIQQWSDVLHSNLWELENDFVKNKFFAPFLLSYNDLPYVEKRCLSYCSIFPKDYKMFKGILIQLWMSQGYLSESKNPEKEGEDCFKNLAMRYFFQDFEKDEVNGDIISCKMHDIMHDFVQFLTKNECCIMDVNEKIECKGRKTRHATLLLGSELRADASGSLYESKGLRTLFVLSSDWSVNSFSMEKLFLNLTCLRTLNLSGGTFEQLPEGIEKLIHLRYVDLSFTSLLELPNSVCDLFNLQVLKLMNCPRLEHLPQEMGKLVNLQHLHVDGSHRVKHLPKGIAKLSCLRTLGMFVVPDHTSLIHKEALELQDLHMWKELQGSLCIHDCGNLQNRGQAGSAQLKYKEYLVKLELYFNARENGGAHDEILEGLEPHPNLESLRIDSYMGNTISPNWMIALINLKRLDLIECEECVLLPSLGKLPSLEFLKIINFPRLERLGIEFLGIENSDSGAPRSRQISFPKLKQLHFSSLKRWKMWELGTNLGEEDEDNCLSIMPSLQSLEIRNCERLIVLADFLRKTPLQHLHILECPTLRERYREGVGEDWPKISHIPNIINYCYSDRSSDSCVGDILSDWSDFGDEVSSNNDISDWDNETSDASQF